MLYILKYMIMLYEKSESIIQGACYGKNEIHERGKKLDSL